jgi:hypothetical protein
MDFLHQDVAESTTQDWSSTRLFQSSEKTYKVNRTTVMVGAPRMLAISTMPASVTASSSVGASSGCSISTDGEGFVGFSHIEGGGVEYGTYFSRSKEKEKP